jgi:hypothetical protein
MLHKDPNQLLFEDNENPDNEHIFIEEIRIILLVCLDRFLVWFESILHFFQLYRTKPKIENKNQPKQNDVLLLTKDYIANENLRFKALFTNKKEEEYPPLSQNCDAEFFDNEKYKEIMKVEHNFLEEKWRTKILMESTPRGNIIMFYDAYKRGFSYYSDQSCMPYNLLNAVAMKYVRVFMCLDFFIDENELEHKTRNVIMIEDEEKIEKEKDEKNKKTMNLHKAPFLQSQSKKRQTEHTENDENGSEKQTNKRTNIFSYKGKVANYSFLKKKPRRAVETMETSYNDIFKKSDEVQRSVMNYKAFKEKQEQK